MLSNAANIRISLAGLISILIHAAFLSMDTGVSRVPVAGGISKKVTVRLVPRRVAEKPVVKSKPVVKAAKKIEKIASLQIPAPVEVVVREIPSLVMPDAPAIPDSNPVAEPEPVTTSLTPEVAVTGETEDEDSPEVILATPLYRKNPPPEYPARARRRHLQGTVVLGVSVSRDGEVEELEIHESSGHKLLDRAALKAVRSWLFEPGTNGGVQVAMKVLVPVRFSLR